MRKELDNTYLRQADGGIVVRARTPENGIVENLVEGKDLCLDVDYTDQQGTPNVARINLEPRVSKVLRVDAILPDDLHLYFLAAQNCYADLDDESLVRKAQTATNEEVESFLNRNIVSTGHWSVIEHQPPAFLISGISRACSHQLVRHRLASYSQQSQRYGDPAEPVFKGGETSFPFVLPPRFRHDPESMGAYLGAVRHLLSTCFSLRAGGAEPEDVRFLFPNAVATRIVMSGNARVWLELIPKRTCARAQQEIDMVITQIAQELWKGMPGIMKDAGPACSRGKCDQGKRSCGKPLGEPLSAFFEDEEYPHDSLIFGMR